MIQLSKEEIEALSVFEDDPFVLEYLSTWLLEQIFPNLVTLEN